MRMVRYSSIETIFNLSGGFRAHRLSAGPQRTHAMLVTREASQRRIDYFVPIRNAIDIYSAIPVPFRFYAIITPKAGWLSEYSIEFVHITHRYKRRSAWRPARNFQEELCTTVFAIG